MIVASPEIMRPGRHTMATATALPPPTVYDAAQALSAAATIVNKVGQRP
jgi:hypothetical protein